MDARLQISLTHSRDPSGSGSGPKLMALTMASCFLRHALQMVSRPVLLELCRRKAVARFTCPQREQRWVNIGSPYQVTTVVSVAAASQ